MSSGQQITDYLSYASGTPSGAPSLAVAGQWGVYQNTASGVLYYWNLLTAAWAAVGGGGSSYAPAFVTKTANYTLLTTDTGILGDATGGAITLTLPTAVGATALYFLAKKDAGANTVTIATTSSQTINGAGTVTLAAQYAGLIVLSDGANWRIVAQVGTSVSLTTATAAISADVTLVNANTFYDVVSVSLAAGTWWITATVTYIDSGGACYVTSKLWNGTTVYAEGQIELGNPAFVEVVALTGIAVLGSTTTVKVSAAPDTGGSILKAKADPTANGSGSHVTTQINAIKIA